jgi:hypothetical protein
LAEAFRALTLSGVTFDFTVLFLVVGFVSFIVLSSFNLRPVSLTSEQVACIISLIMSSHFFLSSFFRNACWLDLTLIL